MSSFGAFIDVFVLPLKNLQLRFLRIEILNGGNKKPFTMSSWVAESYVAFACIWPIVWGIASDFMKDHPGQKVFNALFHITYEMLCLLMSTDLLPVELLLDVIKLFCPMWIYLK